MNRSQQLLNDEIKRLFFDGIDEGDAFAQLNIDTRFDSVRRSSVQSLYRKFKKDADKKAKEEEAKERLKQEKQCQQYKQSAKNLQIYEGQSINSKNEYFNSALQGRYAFIRDSMYFMRTLRVYDLYQNISKKISIPTDVRFCSIRSLSSPFVLLDGITPGGPFTFLAYVDLVEGKLEAVQKIEHGNYKLLRFHVDSSDLSKFALEWISNDGISVIKYSLFSDGTIDVGEEITFEDRGQLVGIESYFGNQMFGLEFENGHQGDMDYASIIVQDLIDEKERKTFELESFPSNICAQSLRRWFRDYVFVSVQFLTGHYGIAFTEPQTRKWEIMEFAVDLSIECMDFVENGNLLVSAGKHRCNRDSCIYEISKVYKVPIRKPESLQVKAWIKTVEWSKKQGTNDPYKTARKYLPLISKIHSILNISER